MKQAIFLDRDGTINEDVGYFCSLDKLKFLPKAFEALRMLQEKFVLFIVTNQSGVARNFFSEEDLIKFNRQIENILKQEEIFIKKTYYCPHLIEEGCICHKPNTFFLEQAVNEYDIDLTKSFVIGDHPHDVELAHNVGAKGIYVLSGHGKKHQSELTDEPCFIAKDLYEATLWIFNERT